MANGKNSQQVAFIQTSPLPLGTVRTTIQAINTSSGPLILGNIALSCSRKWGKIPHHLMPENLQIIHDEEFHGEGILTINVVSEEKGKDKGIVKILKKQRRWSNDYFC